MRKFIFTLLVVIAFVAGRSNGINHAVTHSEIWLNEWVEAKNGDFKIHISLDGQDYDQELWIY